MIPSVQIELFNGYFEGRGIMMVPFGCDYSYILIEKAKDFPSDMLPSSLFMIHDSSTRSKNNISNTSRRQQLIHPLLQIRKTDIKSRRNNTAFVKSSIKLDNNLSRSMVINFLKFANVA